MAQAIVIFTARHLKDDRRLYFQSVHILGGGSQVSDFSRGSQVSDFSGGGFGLSKGKNF